MAYLKKRYREILERIDKELKLPKGWSYFVKKEASKDNFIIKSKGICTCGNCKTEFKSEKKINELEKCPKCRKEYIIKRSNYQWHIFEPRTFILLDRLDENWIIRLFQSESRYVTGKIYHSKAAEYGRIILNENLELVNNRLYSGMWGCEKVNTYAKVKTWRQYHNSYQGLSTYGKVFHNNLKELFKDTEYKYSQLWTLAKKEDEIDLVYYLTNNLPSTEMLIKMKLYKLALCPKTFNKKGSFEKIFGINKCYYNFMKKNNIDIDELNILKLYKKKDINRIKYLKQFRLEHITKISKYVSLDKFIEFAMSKRNFDMNIYSDYIGFLEDLELDLKDKNNLFPDDIKAEHDKYQEQVAVRSDEIIKRNIEKRYKQLEKNIYFNNKYFIVPAKSIESLEDESKQQSNCVRTYAKKYSKEECDIYFMRERDKPNKSLVTVEEKNNRVVQSRIKYNKELNKIQQKFLDKWEDKILNVA